jgi:hypothetical protein
MNEQNYFDQTASPRQNLQVWCCDNCQAVHFKAGQVLLNFSKTEFADLTHALMEIYRQEFGGLEFYKLTDSITREREMLTSREIN